MKNHINKIMKSRGIFPSPLINEPAPSFKAQSTKGPINFPQDYKGRWVMLISYNDDYCPVCSYELLSASTREQIYKDLGLEIVVFSPDTLLTHYSWLEDLKKINYGEFKDTEVFFPLIADTNREIAQKYGLLESEEDGSSTIRGLFLIDPTGKIRASSQYPVKVGRGSDEIIRTFKAVKKASEDDVSLPANWQPGEDVLLKTPNNIEDIYNKDYINEDTVFCPTWFYCFKRDNNNEEEKVETENKNRPNNGPFGNGFMGRRF